MVMSLTWPSVAICFEYFYLATSKDDFISNIIITSFFPVTYSPFILIIPFLSFFCSCMKCYYKRLHNVSVQVPYGTWSSNYKQSL